MNTCQIAGQLHVTVEAVAASFEVEVTWIRAVRDEGLVGVVVVAGREYLPARELDRFAEILRLARGLGYDLGAVALLLR